jgi:hypothetical protein
MTFFRTLGPRVSEAISSTIQVIGITSLLFIAVNIAALAVLDKPPEKIMKPEPSVLDVAIWPINEDGQAVLRKSMGDAAAKRIKESYLAMPSPYFAMHPTLHYVMLNVNNPVMHIGVEGVRYLPGWTDGEVRARLHGRSRPLILLLGGSTTLGHGLRDDETIAAYLQEMVGEQADILNLGVGAYDQIREIDRLEYLLREGIRPTAVIFLDGLNDIFDLARSNYRWNDKIVYHGMVSGRGDVSKPDNAFNINSSASVRPLDFAVMLNQALPASRFILEKTRAKPKVEDIKSELDPFVDMPFNYAQQSYLYSHWPWFGDRNLELLKREAVDYYTNNLAYIKGISEAFQFSALVFYQPFGHSDPNNAFNGKGGESLPGYRYLTEMNTFIRSEIRSGRVAMEDLSESLNDLSSRQLAYIDCAHYSPQANRHLAEIYRDKLLQNGALK